MAQVLRLGLRVGNRLALFCIHHMNRVYFAIAVTSWTCYGTLYTVSQKKACDAMSIYNLKWRTDLH